MARKKNALPDRFNDPFIRKVTAETKLVESGAMAVTACLSSEDRVDRDGDIVVLAGMDLGEHQKNPVALWLHDQDNPIGCWESPDGEYTVQKQSGAKLYGTCYFAQDNERAEELFKLYEAKALRAWSIGFRPNKGAIEQIKDGAGNTLHWRINGCELLEVSAVAVGSNKDALTMAVHKIVKDEALKSALTPYIDVGKAWSPGAEFPIVKAAEEWKPDGHIEVIVKCEPVAFIPPDKRELQCVLLPCDLFDNPLEFLKANGWSADMLQRGTFPKERDPEECWQAVQFDADKAEKDGELRFIKNDVYGVYATRKADPDEDQEGETVTDISVKAADAAAASPSELDTFLPSILPIVETIHRKHESMAKKIAGVP